MSNKTSNKYNQHSKNIEHVQQAAHDAIIISWNLRYVYITNLHYIPNKKQHKPSATGLKYLRFKVQRRP